MVKIAQIKLFIRLTSFRINLTKASTRSFNKDFLIATFKSFLYLTKTERNIQENVFLTVKIRNNFTGSKTWKALKVLIVFFRYIYFRRAFENLKKGWKILFHFDQFKTNCSKNIPKRLIFFIKKIKSFSNFSKKL